MRRGRRRPGGRAIASAALTNGGGYAEYCVPFRPRSACPGRPATTPSHAAALPETYFTVWANLFMLGRLAAGETALVHGGTSGIGVTAIQLAREFGATVYATAGSAREMRGLREARRGGGDQLPHARTSWRRSKRLTDGRGVDVVLDMVGASYFIRNLRCLAMDGRLVLIAFLGGSKTDAVDLVPIMTRRLTVTGSTMRPRTAAQKAAIAAALREKLWPVLEAGRAGPVIHATFPLAQAAEAHRLMESSAHIGKIMLRVAT